MRTFRFFEPHDHARVVRPAPLPPARVSCDAQGRFRFNQAASECLDLYQRHVRVRLGNAPAAPTEWVLQAVEVGGHPLRDMNPASSSRKTVRGFVSIALRAQLVASLPLATATQTLSLVLDPLSMLVDGSEAWLLDTAPYCRRVQPKPKPAAPAVSAALAMTLPPGLRQQLGS